MRAAHVIYTKKGIKDERNEREPSQSQAIDPMDIEPIVAGDGSQGPTDDKSTKGGPITVAR
jgi:hypothetical protein